MNRKGIEDLIKFVKKTGVSEVSIEQEGFKITIKTHPAPAQPVQATMPPAMPTQSGAYTVITQPVAPTAAATEASRASAASAEAAAATAKYITIKSPMIGTFYRSSSPDKPSFVNVGDEIKPGKVICIIEAMKLFNEIESEHSGKIVKVLVDNATPVEYDQPLFLVDPA